MTEKEEKFWKIASTRKGFEGKWIHINLDDIILPDGSRILFEAVEFQRHGAGIVAENSEGNVVLVKNYRYINDYLSWEVPAGTIAPGVSAIDCVIEELKEEAGCAVERNDVRMIGTYYPSIGSSTQVFHCFIAKNVREVPGDIDANEILEKRWFRRDELVELIRSGEMKDGFSLYLILRYLYHQD